MPKPKSTIAFYNLENLFDTQSAPNILDDAFTPDGKLHWDLKRYHKKVEDLANVIAKIGVQKTGEPPIAIGLAEVENKKVLNNLIDQPALKKEGYAYVHFNSPDERGMDTALLYRKSALEILHAKPFHMDIRTSEGIPDDTRDILYVKGKWAGLEVHFFVNHWPSRGVGEEISRTRRIQAADQLRKHIDALLKRDPDARVLIMGDFNDNPNSTSVKEHLVKDDLYNPMVFLLTRHAGSSTYRSDWFLFDQIILSNNWMKFHDNAMVYHKAMIHAPDSSKEQGGKYEGQPFRTYTGDHYLGGPSDHFPVYVVFKAGD